MTPPSPDKGLREEVARIIDPRGWATFDRQMGELRRMAARGDDVPESAWAGPSYYTRDSLKKADQILALPVLSREGWREEAYRGVHRIIRILSAAELHEHTRLLDARDEAIAVAAALSASPLPSGVGGSSRGLPEDLSASRSLGSSAQAPGCGDFE